MQLQQQSSNGMSSRQMMFNNFMTCDQENEYYEPSDKLEELQESPDFKSNLVLSSQGRDYGKKQSIIS